MGPASSAVRCSELLLRASGGRVARPIEEAGVLAIALEAGDVGGTWMRCVRVPVRPEAVPLALGPSVSVEVLSSPASCE